MKFRGEVDRSRSFKFSFTPEARSSYLDEFHSLPSLCNDDSQLIQLILYIAQDFWSLGLSRERRKTELLTGPLAVTPESMFGTHAL